jgi:hypothetical protein
LHCGSCRCGGRGPRRQRGPGRGDGASGRGRIRDVQRRGRQSAHYHRLRQSRARGHYRRDPLRRDLHQSRRQHAERGGRERDVLAVGLRRSHQRAAGHVGSPGALAGRARAGRGPGHPPARQPDAHLRRSAVGLRHRRALPVAGWLLVRELRRLRRVAGPPDERQPEHPRTRGRRLALHGLRVGLGPHEHWPDRLHRGRRQQRQSRLEHRLRHPAFRRRGNSGAGDVGPHAPRIRPRRDQRARQGGVGLPSGSAASTNPLERGRTVTWPTSIRCRPEP